MKYLMILALLVIGCGAGDGPAGSGPGGAGGGWAGAGGSAVTGSGGAPGMCYEYPVCRTDVTLSGTVSSSPTCAGRLCDKGCTGHQDPALPSNAFGCKMQNAAGDWVFCDGKPEATAPDDCNYSNHAIKA